MNFTEEALRVASEFQTQIVPHTRFQLILDSIEEAIEIGSSTGIFAGVRVAGPTGSGKTALIEHMRRRLEVKYGGDGSTTMISASLKENPSVSSVQDELTDQFQLATRGARTSANNNDMNGLLVTSIRTQRVKLIAIDEFQHVFYSGGVKVATPVIDWLKRLMNFVQVPVVLLGTLKMDQLETVDPQLTSRIPTVGRMSYFRLNGEWYGFLKSLAGSCKGMDLSKIYEDKAIAAAIHVATDGSPRLTKALLVYAISMGLTMGEIALTASILKGAYAKHLGQSSESENPFAGL